MNVNPTDSAPPVSAPIVASPVSKTLEEDFAQVQQIFQKPFKVTAREEKFSLELSIQEILSLLQKRLPDVTFGEIKIFGGYVFHLLGEAYLLHYFPDKEASIQRELSVPAPDIDICIEIPNAESFHFNLIKTALIELFADLIKERCARQLNGYSPRQYCQDYAFKNLKVTETFLLAGFTVPNFGIDLVFRSVLSPPVTTLEGWSFSVTPSSVTLNQSLPSTLHDRLENRLCLHPDREDHGLAVALKWYCRGKRPDAQCLHFFRETLTDIEGVIVAWNKINDDHEFGCDQRYIITAFMIVCLYHECGLPKHAEDFLQKIISEIPQEFFPQPVVFLQKQLFLLANKQATWQQLQCCEQIFAALGDQHVHYETVGKTLEVSLFKGWPLHFSYQVLPLEEFSKESLSKEFKAYLSDRWENGINCETSLSRAYQMANRRAEVYLKVMHQWIKQNSALSELLWSLHPQVPQDEQKAFQQRPTLTHWVLCLSNLPYPLIIKELFLRLDPNERKKIYPKVLQRLFQQNMQIACLLWIEYPQLESTISCLEGLWQGTSDFKLFQLMSRKSQESVEPQNTEQWVHTTICKRRRDAFFQHRKSHQKVEKFNETWIAELKKIPSDKYRETYLWSLNNLPVNRQTLEFFLELGEFEKVVNVLSKSYSVDQDFLEKVSKRLQKKGLNLLLIRLDRHLNCLSDDVWRQLSIESKGMAAEDLQYVLSRLQLTRLPLTHSQWQLVLLEGKEQAPWFLAKADQLDSKEKQQLYSRACQVAAPDQLPLLISFPAKYVPSPVHLLRKPITEKEGLQFICDYLEHHPSPTDLNAIADYIKKISGQEKELFQKYAAIVLKKIQNRQEQFILVHPLLRFQEIFVEEAFYAIVFEHIKNLTREEVILLYSHIYFSQNVRLGLRLLKTLSQISHDWKSNALQLIDYLRKRVCEERDIILYKELMIDCMILRPFFLFDHTHSVKYLELLIAMLIEQVALFNQPELLEAQLAPFIQETLNAFLKEDDKRESPKPTSDYRFIAESYRVFIKTFHYSRSYCGQLPFQTRTFKTVVIVPGIWKTMPEMLSSERLYMTLILSAAQQCLLATKTTPNTRAHLLDFTYYNLLCVLEHYPQEKNYLVSFIEGFSKGVPKHDFFQMFHLKCCAQLLREAPLRGIPVTANAVSEMVVTHEAVAVDTSEPPPFVVPSKSALSVSEWIDHAIALEDWQKNLFTDEYGLRQQYLDYLICEFISLVATANRDQIEEMVQWMICLLVPNHVAFGRYLSEVGDQHAFNSCMLFLNTLVDLNVDFSLLQEVTFVFYRSKCFQGHQEDFFAYQTRLLPLISTYVANLTGEPLIKQIIDLTNLFALPVLNYSHRQKRGELMMRFFLRLKKALPAERKNLADQQLQEAYKQTDVFNGFGEGFSEFVKKLKKTV